MEVFIVYEKYDGRIQGIFDSEEKAIKFIKENGEYEFYCLKHDVL